LSQRSNVLRPAPVKNAMYFSTSAFICSSMSSTAGRFMTSSSPSRDEELTSGVRAEAGSVPSDAGVDAVGAAGPPAGVGGGALAPPRLERRGRLGTDQLGGVGGGTPPCRTRRSGDRSLGSMQRPHR